MARLISHHWDSLNFPKAKGFLGTAFGTGRGVTQGYPALPMIFNIMVDAEMREAFEVVYGPQEAQHRMGWPAGESNLVLYADYGRIAGRDHISVQDALTVTVAMYRRVGLDNNMEKTKALVCTPVYIWGKWIEAAYNHRNTREG